MPSIYSSSEVISLKSYHPDTDWHIELTDRTTQPPRIRVLKGRGVHWRHLVNTTERPTRGGNYFYHLF